MSWLIAVAPIVAASVGLGYVIGNGKGYDEGYRLGYHEGEFDAAHQIAAAVSNLSAEGVGRG